MHPFPLDHVPPFIFDYQVEHIFVIEILFAHALTTTPHLSSSGLSSMVYEHISGCFIFKDPYSGFSILSCYCSMVISLGQWPQYWGLTDYWQCQRTLKVFVLLQQVRSLFDLLINLLSYNFRGYLKSTYPPISLEY